MNEINQLELTAYIIVINRKITEYKDKSLDSYINLLKSELINTPLQQILNNVDLRLFNDFIFRAKLNLIEISNYSKLIFSRLLNYYHKEFKDEDIIKESQYIYSHFTTRTSLEEVNKLKI